MSSKCVTVLIGLACVCLPAAAIPRSGKGGNGGSGSSGGCATASIGLSTYTATAGTSTVGVYGPITNCSGGKAKYTVVDTFISACGAKTTITSAVVGFAGGQSQLVSSSYPVPAGVCAGSATVTRAVQAGGVLASDSKALTILAP